MYVKAKHGVHVPFEHNPKKYITAEKAVKIEKTAYYVRRMREGDLIEEPQTKGAAAPPARSEV